MGLFFFTLIVAVNGSDFTSENQNSLSFNKSISKMNSPGSDGAVIIAFNLIFFLGFVDFGSDVLSSFFKTMITGPKIFYPKTKKIQSAGGMLKKNAIPYHLGYGDVDSYEFDYPREVDYVTGAAIALKRKIFEITGLFDTLFSPVYYEETDKCLATRKLGFKVLYVPQSIVYHHESTTFGVLSEKFLKNFHKSRFKYIYKNYNFSEFLSFVLCELKWFLFCCGNTEKNIVAQAHLKTIFSPQIRFRKKIPLK